MTDVNQNIKTAMPFLQACAENKKLLRATGDGWIELPSKDLLLHLDTGVFNPSNWRVKPDAAKVVPHTFETAPSTPAKVRRKSDGLLGWLTWWATDVSFNTGKVSQHNIPYDVAAEQFEYLSGAPCGIEQKEESEWPKWAVSDGDVIWQQYSPGSWWCGEQGGAGYIWDDLLHFFKGVRLIPRAQALTLIAAAQKEAK